MAPALTENSESRGALAPLGDGNARDMERMLAELGGGDILQAIKCLEGDAVESSSSSGTDDGTTELISIKKLERRCSLLARRVRMLVARAVGQRVAGEAANALSSAAGGGSVRAMLRRAATLRAQNHPSHSLQSQPAPPEVAQGLRSTLNQVSSALDSDATLSSSGGESDDELVSYDNSQQQPLPMHDRALWRYVRERARIGSRWAWLSAHVQELDYKLRQHQELLTALRNARVAMMAEKDVITNPEGESCARLLPVNNKARRKLLQAIGLHTAAPRAARPADIRCGCQWPISGCLVCTGRSVATAPIASRVVLPPQAARALLDPGYHPVLSSSTDISPSLQLAGLACSGTWPRAPPTTDQSTSSSSCSKTINVPTASVNTATSSCTATTTNKVVHHSKAKKNKVSVSGRKRERESISNQTTNEQQIQQQQQPIKRQRNSTSSYDIDNIVIPPSIVANTRLEILQYKEIITPKWRVMEMIDSSPVNNGVIKANSNGPIDEEESEEEDMSEEAVIARHARALQTERISFMQPRRIRNSNSVDNEIGIRPNGRQPAQQSNQPK